MEIIFKESEDTHIVECEETIVSTVTVYIYGANPVAVVPDLWRKAAGRHCDLLAFIIILLVHTCYLLAAEDMEGLLPLPSFSLQ